MVDEWVAVRRLIVPFARWLEYDRAGLGHSEGPKQTPPRASPPSWISYSRPPGCRGRLSSSHTHGGGYTSRGFLHRRDADVVGIVFVDCCTEMSLVRRELVRPPPYVAAIARGVDFLAVAAMARDRVLSDEECESMHDPGAFEAEECSCGCG